MPSHLCCTSTMPGIAYLMNNNKIIAIIYEHLFCARHGSIISVLVELQLNPSQSPI